MTGFKLLGMAYRNDMVSKKTTTRIEILLLGADSMNSMVSRTHGDFYFSERCCGFCERHGKACFVLGKTVDATGPVTGT